MTPDALHAWVVTQWQAMLDTARAATPGPWNALDANEGTSSPPGWMVANDAFHNPPDDEDAPWVAVEIHTGGRDDAEHVAAFDPTFAIAVCEAALERMGRHAPVPSKMWEWAPQIDGLLVDHFCSHASVTAGLMVAMESWPCPDFLFDAAPFRTHPDFPEELRRDG